MRNDPASLTAAIREKARALGFFKTGIVRAGPLPDAGRFDRWLDESMHGEMHYLVRQADKRRNPSLILPGARSLVVVAMNYYMGEPPPPAPLQGRISRYAWAEDYHRVIRARLEELYAFIRRQEPEAAGVYYTDTGPVMEKAWGARTSLGWQGKNSNLITRERGSWFFLGVILLDLELEYDSRAKDYCGTCTRCMAACPTGAIAAPYVVDARLCISYLTIELHGAIPRPLRPLIGDRIFGCDDCQEVCPWNRFAALSGEPRPAEPTHPAWCDLVLHSALTREEFEARFRASAVRRCGRDGFVRNVAVALGNSRHPGAGPALARALGDASPLVRAHAAWGLGRIASPAARAALAGARGRENEPSVIEEIDLALAGATG